jgi:hypothetical protein
MLLSADPCDTCAEVRFLVPGATAVLELLAFYKRHCTNPLRGNSVVRTVLRNGWSSEISVRSR